MSYSRSGHGSRAWWWGLHFQQGIKGKSFGAGAVWKAWLKQGSMHVGVREKGALGWGHSKQRPQGAIRLLLRGPQEGQRCWSGGRATVGGNEVRGSQARNLWAMGMTWSFILPVLAALVMMVLHVRRAWLDLPFEVMVLAPSSRPDFPGSSVVKTPCYKCREWRFDPWSIKTAKAEGGTYCNTVMWVRWCWPGGVWRMRVVRVTTFWTHFKGGLYRICSQDWWQMWRSFPDGSVVKIKILPASGGVTGESGSVPASGRCSGEGNSNSLQYSCLENSMDRGPLKATVHRVAKSWTQVKRLSTHTHKRKRGPRLTPCLLTWGTWGEWIAHSWGGGFQVRSRAFLFFSFFLFKATFKDRTYISI